RGPAGAAWHRLREVIAERHAVGAEGVEIRRAQARMPEIGQAVGPPLVHHDEQDVLRPGGCVGHRASSGPGRGAAWDRVRNLTILPCREATAASGRRRVYSRRDEQAITSPPAGPPEGSRP